MDIETKMMFFLSAECRQRGKIPPLARRRTPSATSAVNVSVLFDFVESCWYYIYRNVLFLMTVTKLNWRRLLC